MSSWEPSKQRTWALIGWDDDGGAQHGRGAWLSRRNGCWLMQNPSTEGLGEVTKSAWPLQSHQDSEFGKDLGKHAAKAAAAVLGS